MNARIRICLIDDDIAVRDALVVALKDANYEVFSAPGAAAGFDLVARESVHAIVTDMNMPGTDGAQLIAQVRAAWPSMPIVAISGASVIDGRSVVEVARERGADAVLTKPFRAEQLASLLAGMIAKEPNAQSAAPAPRGGG